MSPPPDIDAYVICATPRTGSTLLCGLLDSSGVAGRPASYFNRKSLDALAEEWGVPRPVDRTIDAAFLRAAVVVGSTPNGIFGVRVMRETMPELIDALASLAAGPVRSDLDLLTETFGRLRFVHLRRRDVVAQAVSWARAEQTHFWHPGEEIIPGGQSPHFDQDLIGQLTARIDDFEAEWRAWFADLGVVPYELAYEDLTADPIGVTRAVLDFLGLKLPLGRTIVARHRRQADELNADWIARFRSG